MTFKTQLQSDLDGVFFNDDEFSTEATYDGNSISVILDYNQDLIEGNPGQYAAGTIWCKKSEVADPQRYQTITVDGVAWRIDDVIAGDDYYWLLSASRDHRAYPNGNPT